MAYASQSGRARTDPSNPRAFAVCQRCGIWYNRVNLQFQFDWRGAQLQNLYILVCHDCYDTPQEQLRAITLPADPVPIFYPSVESFEADETDYLTVNGGAVDVIDSNGNVVRDQFGNAITSFTALVTDPITGIPIPGSTYLITQDCKNLTAQPIGEPNGLDQNAVMPLFLRTKYGVQLPILSIFTNGCLVTMTCSAPHGLATNNIVSIAGLDGGGNGFASVTVTTSVAFTYQTVLAGTPSLTPTTRVVTALVGLPLGYAELP